MLSTPICKLLGIEVPIIQAGMGPFTSAELVAAVSNAGGLGSLGAGARNIDNFMQDIDRLPQLTSRPFAINHTLSPSLPNAEVLRLSLEARPRVVSFALGEPDAYVRPVHDAGMLVMHQVTTVQQAYHAAQAGVDIIIAQGSEAGGFGGSIASLVLIPQVVDAVRPVPVIAAGGIADGRGIAAALVLGAQGVNIGTRFLASNEAPISLEWKQAILAAQSPDAIRADFWSDIFPPNEHGYPALPRSLSSPFIKQWISQPERVKQEANQLQAEIGAAIAHNSFGELFPFTGQSAGLIKDILPVAEIIHRLVTETEAALKQVLSLNG